MTSVLNHLRPLSGNRIKLFILLIAVIGLGSCNTTKKASSSRTRTVKVNDKKRPTDTKRKKRVKRPEWKEGRDNSRPPITVKEDRSAAIDKEAVYDIAYLLPLDAANYDASSRRGQKFMNYFAGMEMAKEILEREGISLNINVADSKSGSVSSQLRNTVNNQTDAIVGLYDTTNLKAAAAYAKKNKIPLVSPWKASTKITAENSYYVQLRPNLDEYYKAIIKDIKDNYKADQVYILRRNTKNDKRMAAFVQRIGQAYYRSSSTTPFTEFEVDLDSLAIGETTFDEIFNPEETNVVILPHFSFSKDEDFVYGCTRRLSVEKGPSKMVLYGMEILLDSDKINFDHYSALNVKSARTKFVDEGDGDVQRFKRRFLEVYGALPTADAYEGYDNLMFIGRNLEKYGKNFQHHLEKDNGYYLQAAYDVQKTFPKGSGDDFKDINYFENKHVDIISFDGRRFKRKIK